MDSEINEAITTEDKLSKIEVVATIPVTTTIEANHEEAPNIQHEETIQENVVTIETMSESVKSIETTDEGVEALSEQNITPTALTCTVDNDIAQEEVSMVTTEELQVIETQVESSDGANETLSTSMETDVTEADILPDKNVLPTIESNVLLIPAAINEENIAAEAMIPTEQVNATSAASTSLSLLAQYTDSDSDHNNDDSKDSDTESVIEVPVSNATNKDYRNQVVEINSDSDSSDSSDSSDVEYLAKMRKVIDKSMATNMDDDDDDDDEEGRGGKNRKRQPLIVKGEMLLDDLPPIEDLHITVPAEECIELGRVHSIVDQLVLVNALPNSVLLDLETVLFLDRGQKVLGEIFDVLGQVADPLYCVRFNSNKQIMEKKISLGDVVYVAPKTEYTQFVILSSLMKMRGSDASWDNDWEPPPRFIDYSDDEQEREARAKQRNKDRPKATDDIDETTKRARSDISDQSSSHTAHSQQATHQRGRGGAGVYRARQHAPAHYAGSPQRGGFQRPSYNAGSWHSNYQTPSQYRAGPPPPHHHYQQRMASPHQQYRPQHQMYVPPHAQFNPYAPPPQHMQQQQHQMSPQQPPPMYVLNPYANPSPQQQTSMYSTPPPPPPGAQ